MTRAAFVIVGCMLGLLACTAQGPGHGSAQSAQNNHPFANYSNDGGGGGGGGGGGY